MSHHLCPLGDHNCFPLQTQIQIRLLHAFFQKRCLRICIRFSGKYTLLCNKYMYQYLSFRRQSRVCPPHRLSLSKIAAQFLSKPHSLAFSKPTHCFNSFEYAFTNFAGVPATMLYAGKSWVTTELAPTMHQSPSLTPGITVTL